MVAIAAVVFLCVIVVFVITLIIIQRCAKKYLNGDYTKVTTDDDLGVDVVGDETYTSQSLHTIKTNNAPEKERKISTESLDTKSFRENILEETKKYSELGAYYREKYPKASSNSSPVSSRPLYPRKTTSRNTSSLARDVPLRKAVSLEFIPSTDKQTSDNKTSSTPQKIETAPAANTSDSLPQQQQEALATVSTSETLFHKAQVYHQYTEENISDKIKARGFENDFAADATLHCSIHYYESSKILFVNIQRLEGLYLFDRNCPQEINFHFKIVPKNRFHSKTRWKAVSSKILSLTHSMGPLSIVDMQKSTLLIRLYGRIKKTFGRQKCYGEVTIILNEFLGKEEEVTIEKKILPKTGKTIQGSTDDLLSDERKAGKTNYSSSEDLLSD